MPQGRRGVAVGIECVDTIVLGRDEYDIVQTFARYIHSRHIQRLGVNLPVHRCAKQLPELARAYPRGREDCLVEILPRSREVIMIS